MKIQRNEAIQNRIHELWLDFLLAGLVNDMMMGEVADHLYIEKIDNEESLLKASEMTPPGEPDPYIDEVTALGFGDTIRRAVTNLYEDPEGMKPFSELISYIDTDELMDLLFDAIAGHIHAYPSSFVTDNPYYHAISIPPASSGTIELALNNYLPYEFFQTYHARADEGNPFFYADLGFFRENIAFPVILENNNVWMSVVVSEIESMRKDIEEAHGHVITYGLGLGYYAFMAAEKPEVESVTVVELNPHVIRLFRENILPQFPHREKIHIIEGDALEFVKTQEDGEYDVAFSDFWGGFYDGLELYLAFMPLTARFQKTKHSYWIESCFMEYFFRPVLMKVFMEKGLGREEFIPEDHEEARRVEEKFEEFLLAKDITVEAPEDLDRLLTDESVTQLMREFAVNEMEKSGHER